MVISDFHPNELNIKKNLAIIILFALFLGLISITTILVNDVINNLN